MSKHAPGYAQSVTPDEIVQQRELGWTDFHPEDFCHRCGRRNIFAWYSPEWGELVGSLSGILCPVCFSDHDPHAIWVLTRLTDSDTNQVAMLATMLRNISNMDDDAERVARCLVDAGWSKGTPSDDKSPSS